MGLCRSAQERKQNGLDRARELDWKGQTQALSSECSPTVGTLLADTALPVKKRSRLMGLGVEGGTRELRHLRQVPAYARKGGYDVGS